MLLSFSVLSPTRLYPPLVPKTQQNGLRSTRVSYVLASKIQQISSGKRRRRDGSTEGCRGSHRNRRERELSTNSLFMKKVKMHTGGQIDMRDLICGSATQSMEAMWATSTGNAKAHLQQKGLMKFISEEEPRTFIYARETPVIAKLCGAVQNVLWSQVAEASQSCIWYQASPGASVILVDTDSIVLLTDRTGSYALMTESMVPIAGRVFLLSEDLTAPDCVSTKEAMHFGTQKQIASGLEFISVLFKMIPHLQMRSQDSKPTGPKPTINHYLEDHPI